MSLGVASFGQFTTAKSGGTSPASYPGITVNLRIRVEDVGTVAKQFTLKQTLPPEYLNSPVKGVAGRLEATVGQSALAITEMMDDANAMLYRAVSRVPKSASMDLKSYREASRFELVFAYADLPIDPRLLRAVGVEIYMDSVAAGDFAAAQQGRHVPAADGRDGGAGIVPLKDNLVMIGVADEMKVVHDNSGDWVTLSGRDLRGVLIDSVAHPARFTDLKLNENIVSVVRQIVDRHPFSAYIDVAASDPNEWPGGKIPSPRSADGITRVHVPAQPESGGVSTDPGPAENPDLVCEEPLAGGNASGPQQSLGAKSNSSAPKKGMPSDPYRNSFWDLITQFCFLVGAVPYFDNELLRVRPIRSLYTTLELGGADPQHPTPFAGGVRRIVELDGAKEQIPVRWFVYGRDVKEWSITRKFNGFKPRVVEVVCLTQDGGKKGGTLLKAQFPPESEIKIAPPGTPKKERAAETGLIKRQNNGRPSSKQIRALFKDAGGFSTYADVVRFPVHGIKKAWQLEAIAKTVYWELARGEYMGTVTTKGLASFGGDASDPDLLRLRPGDAIRIVVNQQMLSNQSPLVASAIDHWRDPYEVEVKRLAKVLGGEDYQPGDENFARILAVSARNLLETLMYFRVTGVKLNVNGDSGVEISADYQSYLEHRFTEANADAPKSRGSVHRRSRPAIFPSTQGPADRGRRS